MEQGTREIRSKRWIKGEQRMRWGDLVEEEKLPGDGMLETASKEVGCETMFDGAPPSGTSGQW